MEPTDITGEILRQIRQEGRDTNRRIDTLRDEMMQRFAAVDARLDHLEGWVDGRLEQVDGRLTKTEGWLDKIDGRLDTMVRQLDGLAQGQRECNRRTGELVSLVGTLVTRSDDVDAELADLKRRVGRIEERLDS